MNPTRRRDRRRSQLLAGGSALALLLAACGGDAEGSESSGGTAASGSSFPSDRFATPEEIASLCPADSAPDSLTFSVFSPNASQLGPAMAGFTEATGVEVEFLENSLTDRLTRLAAEAGSPTIDLAIVPINEVPALLANGVVEETDTSIPNYEQLADVAKVDGGYGSSILQFGIAYNPEFVTETPTSWNDLFDGEYAGHIGFPTMPNSGGYATLAALSEANGGSYDDLSTGVETVAAARDDIATFYPFSTAIEPQVVAGDIWIYPDIGGSVLAAKDRGVPVEFVIPEEGGPAGLNTLVVPAGSDHVGCTKALVSWMLGEEMQTTLAEVLHYGTTSTLLELPEDVASSVYPLPGSDDLVELPWPDIAATGPDVLDQWNREVIG